MHEVLGIEDKKSKKETIKSGYKYLLKLLENHKLPAYFDNYGNVPTEAQLQAEIDKFPSDELTDEDCLVMLKSCLK